MQQHHASVEDISAVRKTDSLLTDPYISACAAYHARVVYYTPQHLDRVTTEHQAPVRLVRCGSKVRLRHHLGYMWAFLRVVP